MTDDRILEWAKETFDSLPSGYPADALRHLQSAARSLISEVRREVLEEAAKVCDKLADDIDMERVPDIRGETAANRCASALLQLAEREGGEVSEPIKVRRENEQA